MALKKTNASLYISNEVMEIIGQYMEATHRKRSQIVEVLITLGHGTPEAKAMLAQNLPNSYKPPATVRMGRPPKEKAVEAKPVVQKKNSGRLKKPPAVVETPKPKTRVRRAVNA